MALTIDKIKNINIPINVSRKPDNYPPSSRGISLYNDSVNLYDAINLFMASAPPATLTIGEGLLGNGSVLSPLSWAGVNHTSALSGNGTVGSPLDVADKGISLSKLAQSGATLNQIIKWDGTNWVAATDAVTANFVPLARELTINGVTYDLSQNRSWTINSMVYPEAGIPISTGSGWGMSIVNNSTNWNTAYSWGNHALAGYLTSAAIGVTVQPYNASTVIDGSYVHTDNNYTTAEKNKLAGIQAGAEVNVNADWNATSGDAQILNKPTIPLVDSIPTDGSANAVSSNGVFDALSFKADLVGGKVPAIQLPSYVDDVLEGYYNGTDFYIDPAFSTIMTGETGKIYINLLNNTSYRYTGSTYVQISNTVSSLNDLTDVTIGTLNNGQILQYNGTTSQWENVSVTIGSGDMQKSVYDIDNDGIVDYAETISVDVRNNSSTDTLHRGTIVYLSGSTGNRPNAVKAQANTEVTSSGTFGVVINDIGPNSDGLVAAMGSLHNLDTRTAANGNPNPFTSDTLVDGDILWLDPNTAGYVTRTKPSAPNHAVFIGIVARTSPTNGSIVYKIQNGYEIDELHNVNIISPLTNNQVLRYNSSNSLWENKTLNFQVPLTLNTTPTSGASTLAGDGTLTIPNYTLAGLGGVPTTRTLTINGTTYDLSADRSWTVSSVGTLNDLTDVVITGTPTTGQVLSYDGTNWVNATGGGGGSAAGSTGQIQFNNAGAFAASANLAWDNSTSYKLNIGAPSSPTGALNVKGTGNSNTTVNLRLTNSGNTELVSVLDNGRVNFYTSVVQVDPTTESLFIASNSTSNDRGLTVSQHSNGVHSPLLRTKKSRGTSSSPTNVLSGDFIGGFEFSAYVGGTYTGDRSLFGAAMTSTTGVSQYFCTGTANGNYTPTLLVAENGNVGIGSIGGTIITGLTLPSARLHVRGANELSTSSALLVQNNATVPVNLLDIRNNGNTTLGSAFNWDNVNGRLGIGTVSPTSPLSVVGAVKSEVSGASCSFVAVNPASNYPRAQFRIGNSTSDFNAGFAVTPSFEPKPTFIQVSNYNNELNSNSKFLTLWIDSSDAVIASASNAGNNPGNVLRIGTNTISGAQAINIGTVATGQNVGINTTSPSAKLHVYGSDSLAASLNILSQNTLNVTTFSVNNLGDVVVGRNLTVNGDINRLTHISGGYNSGGPFNINNFNGSAYIINIASNGGSVLVGTPSIDSTAQFQINSTTKGFLQPRMTTTQRDAISATPAAGLSIYNSSVGRVQVYNGTTWVDESKYALNRQTASYTLVLADTGKLVETNVATANTVTVPLNSTQAFEIGARVDIIQYGAGQTTITPTAGVTIRSANGWTKINSQYGAVSLVKIGTDEWYLFGNLNA